MTLADRRAAAEQVIESHPQLSDRAISDMVGLAPKTVAAIRRRCAETVPQATTRVGKDGKRRPLNSAEGRRRAAQVLTEQPNASLRKVAHDAGISPATAADVRRRLQRGEPPVAVQPDTTEGSGMSPPGGRSGHRWGQQELSPATGTGMVPISLPLGHDEHGRLVCLLLLNVVAAKEWPGDSAAMPSLDMPTMARLARDCGQMWLHFAQQLDSAAELARACHPFNCGIMPVERSNPDKLASVPCIGPS